MKKINCLLLFFTLIVVGANVAFGLSTPDYPYYNCPSMEKYSPAVNASSYCVRPKPLKPSEYKLCVQEYNDLYGEAKKEYRSGKCKLSDVRYTQISYGVAACKVEYTIKPEPKIVSATSSTPLEEKCVQRLITVLKKAYPKIK